MSTQFDSHEDVISFILSICKYPVKRENLQEDPELKCIGMEGFLLEDPETSEEIKKGIRAKIDAQKGYKAQTPGGELAFVIGPFRDGFDCFVINKNGTAVRI